jgi:hypothetical protein
VCRSGRIRANFEFVQRSAARDVLGLPLPVAAIEDVLAGKIWAAQDTGRAS